jgi:hypothetical protein
MPLVRYPGFDRGQPEPAPAPKPSTEAIALRDAQGEIAMLNNRLRQVEAALRAAHHVLQPYARGTPQQ